MEVAPQTEESEVRGLSPETLLERLGFPRSQQHKEVRLHAQRRKIETADCLLLRDVC